MFSFLLLNLVNEYNQGFFPFNSTLFSKCFILSISGLKFLLKFYEKFIIKLTIAP